MLRRALGLFFSFGHESILVYRLFTVLLAADDLLPISNTTIVDSRLTDLPGDVWADFPWGLPRWFDL